jgi:hypothetical protein
MPGFANATFAAHPLRPGTGRAPGQGLEFRLQAAWAAKLIHRLKAELQTDVSICLAWRGLSEYYAA